MSIRHARLATLLTAAAVLVGGCSGATEPAAVPPAAPSASAGPSQAVALCQRYAATHATLRRMLAEVATGPVLGPGLSLVLIAPRDLAATPGITDPELAAAMAELTAALDNLGAQAEAKLPPGADPLSTPVPIDPARAVAATAVVEQVCASRK